MTNLIWTPIHKKLPPIDKFVLVSKPNHQFMGRIYWLAGRAAFWQLQSIHAGIMNDDILVSQNDEWVEINIPEHHKGYN